MSENEIDPVEAPEENTEDGSQNPSPPFDLSVVIEQAKQVILDPIGFYRNMPTSGGYTNPLIFVVVMAVATIIIGFLFNLVGLARFNPMLGAGVTFAMIFVGPVFAVIGSFIGAAVMYVIWKLMGSERNYETAYRSVAYSFAIFPIVAVISFIPYIANLIKALWAGFLIYTASVEVHSIKAQTAKIVIGILTAINVLVGFSSEKSTRHKQDRAEHYGKVAEEFEKEYKDGAIGNAFKELENVDEMTPEEAGKQFGEFLKGMEKFSKGLEESVKEKEEE